MKLRNKTLSLLVVLVVVSLGGLVVLQYVLMAGAFELKQQAFRRNVNAALNAVVQQLETGEALRGVYRVAVKDPGKKFNMQMYGFHDDSLVTLSVTNDTTGFSNGTFVSSGRPQGATWQFAPPARWNGETMSYTLRTPQHVLIRAHNQETGNDTVVVNAFMPAGEHTVALGNSRFTHGRFILRFVSDSTSYAMEVKDGITQVESKSGESTQRRTALVESVVDKLFLREQLPIVQRLNTIRLDSIIGSCLVQTGIELPFAYGVIAEQNDSLQLVHPAAYAQELKSTEFKTRLFPNDISFSFNQLALFFPGLQAFLLKQIGVQLLLTILFMAIIVYCFASTIRTIIQQKAFSVRLMDFVNNMTHEFKTPISTISVAAETLLHPTIVSDAGKIKRYTDVIQDENARMRHQVDKILQMAVLEEGTYTLKRTPVDLHEIITKAVDNARMQVGSTNGTLTSRLDAERSTVGADAVHLTNIINNLLDNAVKYSGLNPEVEVSTANAGDAIRLRISDKGIGIEEKDRERVFEKYFRVHTGNVHNVKGFGLGLSYVKLMTEAHGGTVLLESVPGKGTTVELSFPLLHSPEQSP